MARPRVYETISWTRYAVDMADPPTVHVLELNPPDQPGPFLIVNRLCHPDNAHVISTMLAPHANELEVMACMKSENACKTCANMWQFKQHTPPTRKDGNAL